jgi:hypothetical protein
MRLRYLIAAFSLALAFLAPGLAGAATATFSNSACSDFRVTSGSGGNVTIECVPEVGPICTLAASTLTPTIGTNVTLTPACTGESAKHSYVWTNAACNTQICVDSKVALGPVTYKVVATSGAGNQGPPATVTVNWVAQSISPPSGCSLTPSPASLPAGGGPVTLTASCSGGGSPTSYSWTGGQIAQITAVGSQSTSITATTTFTVTPSNSAGAGNTASATVTVAGGGGGGGGSFCDKYTNVIFMDVPWGGIADTRSNGTTFLPNGILVAKFTVPASWVNTSGYVGKAQVAEYGDPPTYRQASLSESACDFRGVANGQWDQYLRDITGKQPYPLQWAFGNTAVAEFTVTGNALFRPQLQPGKTYYYNIRNWNPWGNGGLGSTSCGGGSCNAIVSINTP